MRRVLALAAVGEIATGLALLVVPSLVGRLLLGEELAGVAIPVARVAGIALIGLGIACWPGTPLIGMLIYSTAVALYLAYVGFAGGSAGCCCGRRSRCMRPWRPPWPLRGGGAGRRRKEISPDGTARSVPSSKETWPSWLDIHRCCYAAGAESVPWARRRERSVATSRKFSSLSRGRRRIHLQSYCSLRKSLGQSWATG